MGNIIRSKEGELAAKWYDEKGLMTQYELSDNYLNSKHPSLINIDEIIFMYKEENNNMDRASRQVALIWWNNLPFDSSKTEKSKKHYFEIYKGSNFTPANDYTGLTGREIEIIYEAEREDFYSKPNPMREKALSNYIRLEHNTDECEGFSDGYEQCQKDMQPLIDSHAEMLSLLKSINEMTNNKIN